MSDTSGPDRDLEETPYRMLGGDAALRALIDRFYDLMDQDPAYALIRRLHASDLAPARDKLYWYLSGWLGGPALYIERFGHPMLRARHLAFPIGVAERDAWMACMTRAMHESGVPESLAGPLGAAFAKTADWMRNRPE